MVRQYTDHLPLFRQAAAFLRDAGINLSRKILSGWVMGTGELLVPVNAAIYGEVAAEGYMQVDDKFDHEGLIHLGCWSHARRPFHQLATVLKTDAPKSAVCRHAIGIVEAIGKLYAHERTLREANAPPEVRLTHRQEHSVPWLEPIKTPRNPSQGVPRRRPPPPGQRHHLRGAVADSRRLAALPLGPSNGLAAQAASQPRAWPTAAIDADMGWTEGYTRTISSLSLAATATNLPS